MLWCLLLCIGYIFGGRISRVGYWLVFAMMYDIHSSGRVIVGRVTTYWSGRGYSTSCNLDWMQAESEKDGRPGDGDGQRRCHLSNCNELRRLLGTHWTDLACSETGLGLRLASSWFAVREYADCDAQRVGGPRLLC